MKSYILTIIVGLFIQYINAFPQNQLPSNAIIVAKDGSGKFNSVQAAVNSLSNSANSERVIYIKNGTYNEQVTIQKDFVTLIGENKDKVIITNNLNNAKPAVVLNVLLLRLNVIILRHLILLLKILHHSQETMLKLQPSIPMVISTILKIVTF